MFYHLKTRHCVLLINCYSMYIANDVKSHMSKDSSLRNTYVAMHINLFPLFKPALYSSTLVIKLFKSSIKLFYAKILTLTL